MSGLYCSWFVTGAGHGTAKGCRKRTALVALATVLKVATSFRQQSPGQDAGAFQWRHAVHDVRYTAARAGKAR
jgi:hypothetical protein